MRRQRESTGESVRWPNELCLQVLGSYELAGREEMTLTTGLLLRTECSSSYCEPLTPGRYLLQVDIPVTNHRRPTATVSIEIIDPNR